MARGVRIGNLAKGSADGGGAAARPGFTLVEILIVVVILAIGASVALTHIGTSPAAQLRGAAIQLASDIQYVQNEAMNQEQRHPSRTDAVVRMVFAGNGYSVYRLEPGGGAVLLPYPQLDYPLHGGSFVVNFAEDPGPLQGVTIASADFGGQPNLEFDYDGTPIATARGEVVLRAGEQRVRVTVEPITGLVAIGELE